MIERQKTSELQIDCDEREQMSLINQTIHVLPQLLRVNANVQVFYSHMV